MLNESVERRGWNHLSCSVCNLPKKADPESRHFLSLLPHTKGISRAHLIMNCGYNGPTNTLTVATLGTPEPHYIPGYLGYVPQAKYRPGNTYGMTSHRVLLDPCIHMSPRSVLNNIYPQNCFDEYGRPGLGTDPFLASQMALVSSRVNSLGRQQYLPGMTPGYTGFVPRFQTILGHTYSPGCNRALGTFEQEQWRDRLFGKELEAMDGWRHCYKTKPWDCVQVPEWQEQASRPMPGCGCA